MHGRPCLPGRERLAAISRGAGYRAAARGGPFSGPGLAQFSDRPHQRNPPAQANRRRPAGAARDDHGLSGAHGSQRGPAATLHHAADRAQSAAKDYALRDFLDLFNHRVTSLFYRAWQKYRLPFVYEQLRWSSDEGADDLVTQCLYCLLGLGTGGLRGRLSFDDETFLFYAGHFAHHPRSAQALERILADYFELPVAVRQFQGQWLYLSEEDQSSLPCPRWPQGLNTQLSRSVVIGQRVWDVEGKFRVQVGPLGYLAFRRLMPFGDVLRPLSQMIRTYVGPQFDFDVQVVLKAAEVPCCRLGGEGTDPSRLGWNTWILSKTVVHDVSDAVFAWEG